jgi:serine/threonine-protein kinase HipA
LFKDGFETESFRENGFYAYDDFYEFGLNIGISKPRTIKILDKYRPLNKQVQQMINRSFLSPEIQSEYMNHYFDRNKRLNYSFLKRI